MNLTVEQIGIVFNANISLSGITAIAGPNKSGKSTIGRALMTFGTLLRRMDELVRNRKLQVFLSKVGAHLGVTEFAQVRFLRLVDFEYQADDLLSPDFWENKELTDALFFKLAQMMSPSRSKAFHQRVSELRMGEIQGLLNSVLEQDETEMMCDLVEEKFRNVFSGQINSLCSPGPEAHVGISLGDNGSEDFWLRFRDGHLSGHSEQLSVAFPKIIYLEPLHFLDVLPVGERFPFFTDRYGGGDCSWRNIFRLNSALEIDVSLEEKRQLEELLDEIKTILGGELTTKDGRLQFRDDSLPSQGMWIELDNLASGLKTMSVVSRALRNHSLRQGSIFVVDEPESNLHPEWQIRFAAVLVQLWKRLHIRVLVATHSPYFLKALEVESTHQGCWGDFSAYLMKSNETGGGTIADTVTGRLNEIYKMFYDPLNNLMA